jgi:hypothetical protein
MQTVDNKDRAKKPQSRFFLMIDLSVTALKFQTLWLKNAKRYLRLFLRWRFRSGTSAPRLIAGC